MTTADPARLNAHLALVEATWDDLRRQKIKPKMVFAFREGWVRILSEDTELLPFEVSTDAGVEPPSEGTRAPPSCAPSSSVATRC
ncbi:MAG: hypothetical protein P3W87_008075 [Gammaproteobacteria bacterium]|nr:hypothetical protein [Gammaproteobacteria bacterium]